MVPPFAFKAMEGKQGLRLIRTHLKNASKGEEPRGGFFYSWALVHP
jgi:hypothetical protein